MLCFLLIAAEFTARKKKLKSVQASHALYRHMLEIIPNASNSLMRLLMIDRCVRNLEEAPPVKSTFTAFKSSMSIKSTDDFSPKRKKTTFGQNLADMKSTFGHAKPRYKRARQEKVTLRRAMSKLQKVETVRTTQTSLRGRIVDALPFFMRKHLSTSTEVDAMQGAAAHAEMSTTEILTACVL